jgi:hypothetical protein
VDLVLQLFGARLQQREVFLRAADVLLVHAGLAAPVRLIFPALLRFRRDYDGSSGGCGRAGSGRAGVVLLQLRDEALPLFVRHREAPHAPFLGRGVSFVDALHLRRRQRVQQPAAAERHHAVRFADRAFNGDAVARAQHDRGRHREQEQERVHAH